MLRDYQVRLVGDIYQAWNAGAGNVMATAATGSGKTVVVGHILKELNVPSVVIAHRQELLGQMALALNREEVRHSIIAPKGVVKQIVAAETTAHGQCFYDPRSQIKVAGVNTLARRNPAGDNWYESVQLKVVDEGHHALKGNLWGQALAMFPNARGLLVTAHAIRGDGQGLGRDADGVVDTLVIGPNCRSLIDRGMLVDYRLCCPPSDIDLGTVHVGANGEFNQTEVRAAVHKSSRIVGDIVDTYLKFAPGALGITFAVDIESATEIARGYTARGIPAEIITGETPLQVRAALMQQFRRRQILQLVSVDVLGEGVDVPAVEVVSFARPTNSFQLFAQQCGRALRLNVDEAYMARWNTYTDDERKAIIAASKKPRALILDHVQNVLRHGLPDMPREYSLERRERKSKAKDDAIPLRACLGCLQPYEAFLPACPWCGLAWVPTNRGAPEVVEGDMVLVDDEILKQLRREIAKVDGPCRIPAAAPAHASGSIMNRHAERQQAQQELRRVMGLYGALQDHDGHELRAGQKKFWFTFGVDVLTAQTLGSTDAGKLQARIQEHLDKRGVVSA